MNPMEQMQVFSRVVETGSFTQAAASLGLAKASVSAAVQQLEARLGTRLLHRSTRRVQLSQDGQLFYERAKDVLADLDELDGMFRQASPQSLRGRLRLDMSTGVARQIVMPRLPELLVLHPELEIEFGSTERRVDLVREGFDCVLRVGPLGHAEAGLQARPLGLLTMVNCLSPAYLARHGEPEGLDDLRQHRLVHYVSVLGARSSGFEYLDASGQLQRQAMAGALTVNNAEAYQAACLAGLGLIQAPRVGVQALLDQGLLREVLPAYRAPDMPLSLLYAHRRQLPARVRVVMDWLAGVVAEHLRQGSASPGDEAGLAQPQSTP